MPEPVSEPLPAALGMSGRVAVPVLAGLSAVHLLNDMVQSLLPAVYPLLKQAYGLGFAEIGVITLTFQLTSCFLQPAVGLYTDKYPFPYSIAAGMGFLLAGLVVLSQASSYPLILCGAALIGTGSAVFHPEATRLARQASGGKLGLAQAVFQVGGQTGGAIGPLLAAFIVVPFGQKSLAWFALAALAGIGLSLMIGRAALGWRLAAPAPAPGPAAGSAAGGHQRSVAFSIFILIALLFSKNAYSASFGSFYTFYLIERFQVSVQASQLMLFLFLAASAAGALIGGIAGDRFGRRRIIWFSILGALPFTLALPFANLPVTAVLTVIINLIMASSFAAILIYAMEIMPGRIGFIGGLFYGLSFGLGGLSAALLGLLADQTSIATVYQLCSLLPAAGLLAWFLPEIDGRR